MTTTGEMYRETVDGVGAHIGAELVTPAVTANALDRISRGRRTQTRRRALSVAAAAAIAGAGALAYSHAHDDQVDPVDMPAVITAEPLETQLTVAIQSGDHDAMRALIAAGANLNQSAADHATFGGIAMTNCDLQALGILDDAGAPRLAYPLDVDDSAVVAAIDADCDAETVLEAAASGTVPATSAWIMQVAANEGSLDLVQGLHAAGLPIEDAAEGWSAIQDAAMAKRDDMVEFLLELGADPQIVVEGKPLPQWLQDNFADQATVDAVNAAASDSGDTK